MAKLLFKMRHVPEDEAQEVRELLEQHEIQYFETFAGFWGMAMPGLWLQDEQQFSEARKLLDEYQLERSTRIKAEYAQQLEQGEVRTMLQIFREEPFRFLAYFAMIGMVLFFSTRFFLSF